MINYIPFELLLPSDRIRKFKRLDFLIKNFEVSYHYSSTLFAKAKRKKSNLELGIFAFAPVYDDGESDLAALDFSLDDESELTLDFDAPDETTTHVLTCPAISSKLHWQEALVSLEDWLLNESVHPSITDVILARLALWRAGDPLPPCQTPHVPTRQAVAAQDALGWENFLLGRLSPLWAAAQQDHFTSMGSSKQGKTWVPKLIRQLWLVGWKMWQHRNHIQHRTLTPQDKRHRAHLLGRVSQQFARGKNTLNLDDHYLLENQQDVRKYSNGDLEEWLDRVSHARAAHSRAVARESRALRAQQQFMVRWQATAAQPPLGPPFPTPTATPHLLPPAHPQDPTL